MIRRQSMMHLPQYMWWFMLLIVLHLKCQRTLGQQPAPGSTGSGSSIPLTEDDLERIEKERTRNVVRLAATDQLNSEIITNRTRAYLSCESGEMIVKINFSAPFRGVAYSDYDRSSPCKFYGDGSKYFEMRLPLKGCGTKQEAPRLFINNIIVRFHRSLELEEDEIKTIICRYPPPQAPPPPSVVAPILEPTPPVPVIVPAKLSEIELLLIICALLFLTLLLLGIGIAYYCLKRRNIRIIRRKRLISPAPSEITKLSSVFDQIRIPRATAVSTESSTEYPSSESDERRTIVSETSTFRNDHFKYENTAFVPEPYPLDLEKEDSVTSVPLPVAHKPIITSANFQETLLQTEYLTEENVIDTHHKRTTACLYKKLPTSKITPSIPDNDNWSQAETEDRLALAPYVKPVLRPRISSKVIEDTYLSNQVESEVDETVTRHKKTTAKIPPKLTILKTDDVFVTKIQETEVTEDEVINQHGIRGTSDHILTNEELTQLHSRDEFRRTDHHSSRSDLRTSHPLRPAPITGPRDRSANRTTGFTSDYRTERKEEYAGEESRSHSEHRSDRRRDQYQSYDMRDTELSHTQRRDHFRMYDERYAVEQETDESIATVPVTRMPQSGPITQADFDDEEAVDMRGGHVSRTATMIYNLSGDFVRRPSIPDDVWSQAETEVRHALTLGGPRSRDLSAYRLPEPDSLQAHFDHHHDHHQHSYSSREALTQPKVTHLRASDGVYAASSGEVHESHSGLQQRRQREQVFTSSYQRESRLE